MKSYNGGLSKYLLLGIVVAALVSPFYTSIHMNCDTDYVQYELDEVNKIWNQYEEHHYSKRTPVNNKSIEIADKLIEHNEIYLFRYWEPFVYDEDQLDWSEDPYGDWTWQFYFHSLRMVSYLINAYELKGDIVYLQKAQWFIESWDENNPCRFQQSSIFAWDDHSTANRITTLIYFWDNYRTSEVFDEEFANYFLNLLRNHGEYTANDANYIWGHNHGIYQDSSLLQLSVLFPNFEHSNEWLETSISRLSSQIDFAVTSEGVHKEHSPSYHYLVMNILLSIYDFNNNYNISFDKLDLTIYKMQEYLVNIVKPDGTTPLVGDSVPHNLLEIAENEITNEHLLYLVSNGNLGEKIDENSIVYQEAGVALFKNNWDINTPIYFGLFNAFHSLVHKQSDDLSFILTYNQTDYFVDSGKYAADSAFHEENIFRTYVKSVFAHNSISVDDSSYSIYERDNIGKSIIEKHFISSNYSYVKVSHTLFDGVKITRTAIFFNAGAVYFHDNIESNDNHKYSQIFNLGKDVNVLGDDWNELLLSSKKDETNMTIRQLSIISDFNQYNGSLNPTRGWQSTELNNISPITSLFYHQEGTDITFNTVINIETNIDGVEIITNDKTRYLFKFDNGDTEIIEI